MAFQTDSMNAQRWLSNFNPDRTPNPHDVDHTGAGRFKEVGRFDPNRSSVSGGIFGGQAEAMQNVPRGNVAAINRVKGRATQGDFLQRLALAEARDGGGPNLYSGNDAEVHYAGARPQAKTPMTAQARAQAILEKQQAVADREAEAQRARQWNHVAKNGLLQQWQTEEDGNGMAAGGKSKTLAVQEKLYKEQQQTLAQATVQQGRQAQMERQQQHHQMQMQQRQQQRQQQLQQRQQSAQQAAMARQQAEEQQRQHAMIERQQRQAQQEQQFKTAWAQNRAKQRGSSGIQFG